MKKLRLALIVSTLSVGLLLILISFPTLGQDQLEIDISGYSTTIFNPATEQLPSQYKGHNLGFLYLNIEQLKSRTAKKDEFETTSDFKKRTEAEFKRPILGTLSLDDIYAFKAAKCETSYDADNQQITAICELSPVKILNSYDEKIPKGLQAVTWKSDDIERGSYLGTNAFGATVKVSVYKSISYELALLNYDDFPTEKSGGVYSKQVSFVLKLYTTPEQARALKSSLGVLLISKLAAPYTSGDIMCSAPTFRSPRSWTFITFYVFAKLLEIWFYDIQTGQIISKIKK